MIKSKNFEGATSYVYAPLAVAVCPSRPIDRWRRQELLIKTMHVAMLPSCVWKQLHFIYSVLALIQIDSALR